MTIKQQLQTLATGWRAKAKLIEDKYSPSAPAQTQIAVDTLETCASEIDDILKTLKD